MRTEYNTATEDKACINMMAMAHKANEKYDRDNMEWHEFWLSQYTRWEKRYLQVQPKPPRKLTEAEKQPVHCPDCKKTFSDAQTFSDHHVFISALPDLWAYPDGSQGEWQCPEANDEIPY